MEVENKAEFKGEKLILALHSPDPGDIITGDLQCSDSRNPSHG